MLKHATHTTAYCSKSSNQMTKQPWMWAVHHYQFLNQVGILLRNMPVTGNGRKCLRSGNDISSQTQEPSGDIYSLHNWSTVSTHSIKNAHQRYANKTHINQENYTHVPLLILIPLHRSQQVIQLQWGGKVTPIIPRHG